jgi:Immunoglobulin-like domain of bacterial spore germination
MMKKTTIGTIYATVIAGAAIFTFGLLSTNNNNNTALAKEQAQQEVQQQPIETKQPVENNSEEAFRNIQTAKQKLQFQLKGEASVFEGTYHYNIKQGSKVIAEDFGQATTGGPAWGKIDQKIDIPVNKLSGNAPIFIELYEFDQESGKQMNTISMPLSVNTSIKGKNNEKFRNLSVTPSLISYSLKGEARMHEGSYHYAVKQGDNAIVTGYSTASMGAPDWGKFDQTVAIPGSKLTGGQPLTLELFGIDEENGKAVHMKTVKLD